MTEVAPVVTALARTMEKIHRDRAIAIDIEAPRETRFRGERQDLEEMVGNLVDNACKWAQSRVAVEVLPERAEAAGERVRCASWSTMTVPASPRRSASRSAHARQPVGRDQARLGPRPVDRG